MTVLYRGAGVGTWWHDHDARLTGFTPQCPGTPPSVDQVMSHIAKTTATPHISLTRSYPIAYGYALFGRVSPSPNNPAYVYEIELSEPLPRGLQLVDPVKELAPALPCPVADISYQHDGPYTFLLGVVDPVWHGDCLMALCPQPPRSVATARPPNLTPQLEALVRVLRDAEIL